MYKSRFAETEVFQERSWRISLSCDVQGDVTNSTLASHHKQQTATSPSKQTQQHKITYLSQSWEKIKYFLWEAIKFKK